MIGAALSFNPFYKNGRIRSYGERGKVDENIDFVGYAANTNYSSSSVLPDDFETFSYEFPELKDYKLPSHHPEDVLSALKQLTGKIRFENYDAEYHLRVANEILCNVTPISPFPSWFLQGVPTFEDFVNIVDNLDKTKHPGFPGCTLGSTKGQVVDEHYYDLYQAVCYRVMALTVVGPYCKTPYDFYATFCSDVSCVSIKEEPIKQSKIGRIIIASSVVTQIVESLLYDPFDETFKASVYESYSAIGVGFTHRDSELLHASLDGVDKVCSDVPFFDGSVTLLEGCKNVETVIHSYTGRGKVKLKESVTNMMFSLERSFFNKFYLIPDGRVFVQVVPGHQSTGRNETANFNTMTRARRSFAASSFINLDLGLEHVTIPLCAGDDSNESYHEQLDYAYDVLKFPLRDVKRIDVPEFCSHTWPVGEKPIGQRVVKSLFKLISKQPFERPAFLSFVEEYSNNPSFPAYLNLISELRLEMNSIMLDIEFPSYVPYKRKRRIIGPLTLVQANRQAARKTKKKSAPKKKKTMVRFNPGPVAQSVCSITDPFCTSAQNAKIPGTNSTRTMTFPCRFRGSMTTNSSGVNAFLILPGFSYVNAIAATITAGVVTFTTIVANPATGGFTPSGYRINSMGIRFKNIAPPLTASGIVRIRGLSALNGTALTSIDTNNFNVDFHDDIPLQDCKDTCIILRKYGEQSEFFQLPAATNPSANVTDYITPFMGPVLVSLEGPVSTACLEFQYFINYELTFQDGDAMNLVATPPASSMSSGLLNRASKYIGEKMDPIVQGGVKIVEKTVMNMAMGYVARAFGGVAGGYAGGPQGAIAGSAGAGMIMDRYLGDVD